MPYVEGGLALERTLIEALSGTRDALGESPVMPAVLDALLATGQADGSAADAVRSLPKLSERDRQRLVATLLDGLPRRLRVFWLWRLGNELAECGFFATAAATFVQAALVEADDLTTRAALLIKAGLVGNNGSLGSGVDQWLVNGATMLDMVPDRDALAVRLTRFMAHYTGARYHLFIDAYDRADRDLEAAVAALDDGAVRAMGLTVAPAQLADVLLLRARLARGRMEVLGSGAVSEVLRLLDEVERSGAPPVLLGAPIDHHIAFQRAAVLRLMHQYDRAHDHAELACRTLTGVSLARARSFTDNGTAAVNRRRLGYVLCLAGEISLEAKPSDIAAPVEYFQAATRAWSEPYYGRGLARACRLHAVALMQEGRRWSEASRLLSESIAHARGTRSIAAEARALASKIALHEMLNHSLTSKQYAHRLAELQQAMSGYWPATHHALARLTLGVPRPRPAPDPAVGRLKERAAAAGLWGEHPAFIECLKRADKAANAPAVLLTGETGTGKTRLARFIHNVGGRKGPFQVLTLAHLPATLMESELFGHTRGAFSGAHEDKPGLIELAHRGTLFLDDVTNAPPEAQAKLLRVLEDRVVRRVGGRQEIEVDFHLICATNKDLEREVREGRFGEDLYYRIAECVVHLPPLRARGRDLQIIGQRFLEEGVANASDLTGRVRALTTNTWDELCGYPWKGNIRQLRSFMAGLVLALRGEDLSRHVSEAGEIVRDFVHEVIQTQPMAAEGDDESTPSETGDEETLHVRIPLTATAFRVMLRDNDFDTKAQVAEYIKRRYVRYEGDAQSILKLIQRKRAFAQLLQVAVRDRH